MAEAIQNFIDGLTPWIVIGAGLILFWKVPVWKTRIEDQVENIGNRLDKVETRLDDLYKLLTHSIDRPVVQSSSPLTLTEYGNTISDRVNADQMLNTMHNNYSKALKDLILTKFRNIVSTIAKTN